MVVDFQFPAVQFQTCKLYWPSLKFMLQEQCCFLHKYPQDLRDVISSEMDDGGDKVLSHDDTTERLPFQISLSQQSTNRFNGYFHHWWRVGQRLDLN